MLRYSLYFIRHPFDTVDIASEAVLNSCRHLLKGLLDRLRILGFHVWLANQPRHLRVGISNAGSPSFRDVRFLYIKLEI